MAKESITKNGRRLHFYISEALYAEIDNWVSMNDTTVTKFCRQSIEYYLKDKRREIIERKLLETCQNLKKINSSCLKGWMITDHESE